MSLRTVREPNRGLIDPTQIVHDLREVLADIAHALNTQEDLIEVAAVALDATGGVSTHPLLGSAVHTDTVSNPPVQGALISGTATPKWERFAKGLTDEVLTMDGSGTDLLWRKLLAANMSLVTGTGDRFVLQDTPTILTPTLVLPTIISFFLSQHDHEDTVGGGQLDAGAVFNAGLVPVLRGGTAKDMSADGGALFIVKQLASGGAFSSALLLNAEIPSTLSGKTMTGMTVGATDWLTAQHAHAAGDSGGQLDAAAIGSGLLPILRGGTGRGTFVPNSIIFMGATTFDEAALAFRWERTKAQLELGTAPPTDALLTLTATSGEIRSRWFTGDTASSVGLNLKAEGGATDAETSFTIFGSTVGSTRFGVSRDRMALIEHGNGPFVIGTTGLAPLVFGQNLIERMRIEGTLGTVTINRPVLPTFLPFGSSVKLLIDGNMALIDDDTVSYIGRVFGTSDITTTQFIGNRAEGTEAAPTPSIVDSVLVELAGNGYDGTNFFTGARLRFVASELGADPGRGARMEFHTALIGTNILAEKMRLGDDGFVRLEDGVTVDARERLDIIGNQLISGFIAGGTGASDDVTIKPNTPALGTGLVIVDGRLAIFPNIPDIPASAGDLARLINFDASFAIAGMNDLVGFNFAPTMDITGNQLGIRLVTGAPVLDFSGGGTGFLSAMDLFTAVPVIKSSLAGRPPLGTAILRANPSIKVITNDTRLAGAARVFNPTIAGFTWKPVTDAGSGARVETKFVEGVSSTPSWSGLGTIDCTLSALVILTGDTSTATTLNLNEAAGCYIGPLGFGTVRSAFSGDMPDRDDSFGLRLRGAADNSLRGKTMIGGQRRGVMTGNPNLTFAQPFLLNATITRSAGNWTTDGFLAGDFIIISETTLNNRVMQIKAVTSTTVLTMEDVYTLTAEGPTNGHTIEVATADKADARLHVRESVVDAEATRIENLAGVTTDNPGCRTSNHDRETTDGTANQTFVTIPVAASVTMVIEAWVYARRTSGGGSADDAAYYHLEECFNTQGGTLQPIGAGLGGAANDPNYFAEDVGGYDANLSVSGANVLLRVTGIAATNIDWHATVLTRRLNT